LHKEKLRNRIKVFVIQEDFQGKSFPIEVSSHHVESHYRDVQQAAAETCQYVLFKHRRRHKVQAA